MKRRDRVRQIGLDGVGFAFVRDGGGGGHRGGGGMWSTSSEWRCHSQRRFEDVNRNAGVFARAAGPIERIKTRRPRLRNLEVLRMHQCLPLVLSCWAQGTEVFKNGRRAIAIATRRSLARRARAQNQSSSNQRSGQLRLTTTTPNRRSIALPSTLAITHYI